MSFFTDDFRLTSTAAHMRRKCAISRAYVLYDICNFADKANGDISLYAAFAAFVTPLCKEYTKRAIRLFANRP